MEAKVLERARRILVLAVTLAGMAGCTFVRVHDGAPATSGAGAPATPQADVVVPELRYQQGRLYATIVVSPEAREPVEAKLVGPGAPDVPLSFKGSCHSLVWKDGEGYNTRVLKDNDACSFDLPRSAARAAEYRIQVRSNGVALGEQAFSLVRVPALGGDGLVVDPRLRMNEAYIRDLTFMLWSPMDRSYEWRQVLIYLVHEGKPANLGRPSVVALRPQRLAQAGDPVIDLLRLELALGSRRDRDEGRWMAVAYAGSRRIGAWTWESKWVATGPTSKQLRGLGEGKLLGGYAHLRAVEPDAAITAMLDADVAKVLAQKEQSYGRLTSVARYRQRIEPRVCAAITRPETFDLIRKLDKMRHDIRGTVSFSSRTHVGTITTSQGGSIDVSVASGGGAAAEAPPRWDTGTTDGTMNSLKTRNDARDKQYAALLRRLDAQAASFRAGCMQKLLEGIGWAPPPPGSDEPSRDEDHQ